MFTEMADEAVLLNGETIGETYLDQAQIIRRCRRNERHGHPSRVWLPV